MDNTHSDPGELCRSLWNPVKKSPGWEAHKQCNDDLFGTKAELTIKIKYKLLYFTFPENFASLLTFSSNFMTQTLRYIQHVLNRVTKKDNLALSPLFSHILRYSTLLHIPRWHSVQTTPYVATESWRPTYSYNCQFYRVLENTRHPHLTSQQMVG